MPNICLIGDVLIDVTLRNQREDLKMRLGGIIHCARALWAMSQNYTLGYISPSYLDSRIADYAKHFKNPILFKIAETLNAPNLILIEEAREVGNQGYELVLREDVEYNYFDFKYPEFEKVLITSGEFDCKKVLSKFKSDNVSLEVSNISYEELKKLEFRFKNVYISTSSVIFKDYINAKEFDFKNFAERFRDFCEILIFKENRGGARAYHFSQNKIYQVASQTKPIQHSVGVGDVFNVVFEADLFDDIQKNLTIASFIAMEYASTTFPENFRKSVDQLLKTNINDLVNLKGVILNWEKRSQINIYIAAPDFDFVDTSLINTLERNLRYHNFTPRRPVKENGQMKEDDAPEDKAQFYYKDHKILTECQILIAVLLYNDPGTLVEIGIASERQIPVLLFDPNNIAKNCMLIHSCKIVTNNIDEIISEVFTISSKL